jgi:hypothetical protein
MPRSRAASRKSHYRSGSRESRPKYGRSGKEKRQHRRRTKFRRRHPRPERRSVTRSGEISTSRYGDLVKTFTTKIK